MPERRGYPALIDPAHPLNLGRLGWWVVAPEGAGTVLYDLAGINHGTLAGATWGPDALAFDGSASRIDVAGTWALASGSSTLAVWIRSTATGGTVISNATTASTGPMWGILGFAAGGQCQLLWRNDAQTQISATGVLAGTSVRNDGTWHHVAATKTGTTVTLYVDGISEASSAVASGTVTVNNLTLGCWRRTTNVSFYNGSLAEASAWNRTLSATEVAQLYREGLAGNANTLTWPGRRTGLWAPITIAAGSVALGATSAAGTAVFAASSSGAVTLGAIAAAGSATGGVSTSDATGAVTLGAASASGAGVFATPASGAVSLAGTSALGYSSRWASIPALTNTVTWLDLSPSWFYFATAKVDGSDIRVVDETSGTSLPIWVKDFDRPGQTGRVYFKASDTSHVHRIYWGDPTLAAASSFATTFVKGTGFDTDWGDLATATSGTNAEAVRLAAATGWTDARQRRVFRRKKAPGIAGTTNSGDLGVRDLAIVRNPDGTIAPDGSGNWVGYYGSQPSGTGIRRTFRAVSSDGGLTWTGHTLVLSPGATEDVSGAIPGTVIKVSGSSYYMFYTGTPGGVCLATSTDNSNWTKQGVVIAGDTAAIVDYTSASVAVPDVLRLAGGTWAMVCESRPSGGAWRIVGFTATSEAGPWTVMNSGHVLLSGNSEWWGTDGYANPKLLELTAGSLYGLFVNGHVGHTGSPTWPGYNFQAGFFTASTYNTDAWTPDAASPPFGRQLNFYGVETSETVIDPAGERVLFVQDYASFSTDQPYADIYRAWPVAGRGGLLATYTTGTAAIAGCALAAGNFTAECHCYMTAARSEDSNLYVLGVVDSAAIPTPNTSSNLASIFRLAIRRTTFANASPGDFQLIYWTTGGVATYWTGAAWTTTVSVAATSDPSREISAKVSDDGTDFILTALYVDDGGVIASASIAKATVGPFSNARFLLVGDPFTNAYAGQVFARAVIVRPYAASDPAIVPTGGGWMAGTGSVTLAGISASGAGVFASPASGSVSLAGISASGSGVFTSPGSGSVSLTAISATGAGVFSSPASGSVTLGGVSAAGTVTFAATASGSVALAGVVAMGDAGGTFSVDATGSVTLGGADASGTGVFTSPAAGSVSLAGSSAAGVVSFTSAASGSVALAGMEAAGIVGGTFAVTATGSVTLARSAASGVAVAGPRTTIDVQADPFGSTVAAAIDPFGTRSRYLGS